MGYKTQKGAGLQKALDYLLPYIIKERSWPHSQREPINTAKTANLLCRAAMHYQQNNNQLYIQACKSVETTEDDGKNIGGTPHIFPP